MKIVYKRLIQSICLLALIIGLSMPVWAQSDGLDLKPSLPQIMEVDRVLLADNIVILDGERYRWPEAARSGEGSTTPADATGGAGQLRYLSQLQPGMRVQVVTDGSAASGSHAPTILRMERAR